MKNKIIFTVLSAILAVAMAAMSAFSQNFTVVRNMGPTLNTASAEQYPVISPNGLSLYFSSDRLGGQGQNDIWVSQRARLGAPWGAPQNLGATVNTSDNELVGSLSYDGRTMFFQSNRSVGGQGQADIWISTRTDPNNDFGWTTPVNSGAPLNSPLNDLVPAYFEDPATGEGSLIFSSNRIGNPSFDYHLYQSTRNANGTFNPPTPIPALNVGGAEINAAIRRDGLEIFITAILPPPEGTYDIWASTRASTTSAWSAPVVVPGINTLDAEGNLSLSPDGSILYFQSDRARRLRRL